MAFEGFGFTETGTDWKGWPPWHQRDWNTRVGLFWQNSPWQLPQGECVSAFHITARWEILGDKQMGVHLLEGLSLGWQISIASEWLTLFFFFLKKSGGNLGWFQLKVSFLRANALCAAQGCAQVSGLHVAASHRLSLRPRRAWKI